MQSATIQLETLTCPSCMQKIEAAVKRLPGIDQATIKVSFSSSRLRLNFDPAAVTLPEIEKAINKVGYQVEKSRVKPA